MRRILLLTRPICPPWDEGSKNFAYTLAKNAGDFEIHLLTCGYLADLADDIIQHQIYTSPKWDWSQKVRAYIFLVKEFNDLRGQTKDAPKKGAKNTATK